MKHPTDSEIDKAILTLNRVIEAAENSNHAGEIALMKAVDAISKPPFFFDTHELTPRLEGKLEGWR